MSLILSPIFCRVRSGPKLFVKVSHVFIPPLIPVNNYTSYRKGAQWLSGRVLDSILRGRGFEPHWHHCVVVLEQDTFILA